MQARGALLSAYRRVSCANVRSIRLACASDALRRAGYDVLQAEHRALSADIAGAADGSALHVANLQVAKAKN
eukprot:3781856-Pleurochrysis_carterae.AAC.1